MPSKSSDSISNLRTQIPHGVQDRFLEEAARRRHAEARLRICFTRWGYQEVIPPTFEFHENLIVGASADLQLAMYRFSDRGGRMLALRADFTPQLARMVATKLFDQPMPLRCCYIGSLFRHEEPQAGRKREFTQAGIELVGAETAAADAEAVALCIAALEALDLHDFQVNLGQMAFFHAVTREIPLDRLLPIREAVDHKNGARLDEVLARASIVGAQRDMLRRLPDLVGGPETLAEARALASRLNRPAALKALDRLAEVHHLLGAFGASQRVILDLGEVRGMEYYTGITFRGVAPGLGWPIISGGRYDGLIAHFGRSLPAVGFGLGIERALLVQTRQAPPELPSGPQLLVNGCDHPICLARIQQLRQRGYSVEVDVLGLERNRLMDQARMRRIPYVLACTGDGWLLTGPEGEARVAEGSFWEVVTAWLGTRTPTKEHML
jgi:ATP phosphoribosyltransferase regulatory subunit